MKKPFLKIKEENRTTNENYTILLFYKYVQIDDPEEVLDWQYEICQELGITGRILIAEEGINATIEGTNEAIAQYWAELTADERFVDANVNTSVGTGTAFPRLSVRVRPEIVRLRLDDGRDINPNQTTGEYLNPDELKRWFTSEEDFEIIDMRNDYEHKVGHFSGSRLPSMHTFRDLPKSIDEIEDLKDKEKPVVTVCTGGIRCEKASGYLKEKGFKNVYQLKGGIHSYLEKYGEKEWEGALYTFDGRVVMNFDETNHNVIGKCDKCGTKTEEYCDCANLECHTHFLCCNDCLYETGGQPFCSNVCYTKMLQHKEAKHNN